MPTQSSLQSATDWPTGYAMGDFAQIWKPIFLSAFVALIGLARPDDIGGLAVLLWAFACSTVILRSLRPGASQDRQTFRLLGMTALLIAIGFLVRGIHGELVGQDSPIPSPADLIHIPAYIMFFGTILSVHRARSTERSLDAWLDAIGVALSVFLVLWSAFLGDFVLSSDHSVLTRFVNSIYTTIILASFTLYLRVTSTPGSRPASYYLLGGAAASFFMVELAGTYSLLHGSGVSLAIAFSPFVYGFAVSAAVHPSRAKLLQVQERAEFRVGPLRLIPIAVAISMPLLISPFEEDQHPVSQAVLIATACSLAGVVIVRVVGLLGLQQRVADGERALAAEIGKLAQLPSSTEVLGDLPQAAARVLPEKERPLLVGDAPEHGNSFALPPSLSSMSDSYLLYSQGELSDHEERLISTLVRDAGLLAASADGKVATARQHSEALLNNQIRRSEKRFRALVQNASDAVLLLNPDGLVTFVSPSIEQISGFSAEAYLSNSLEWVVHPNDWERAVEALDSLVGVTDQTEVEVRSIDASGNIHLLSCVLSNMTEVEGVEGIVVNVSDMTDRRQLEATLRDAEIFDPLTLLFNRASFTEAVESAIRRSSITQNHVMVAVINLDDFRLVNEGHGTQVGDQVLTEVAARIRQQLRIDDVIARLSGDEFGILGLVDANPYEANAVIERILSEISKPMNIDGLKITLRATAGISFDTDGSSTALRMLRSADTAVDIAKEKARGSAIVFDDEMGETMSRNAKVGNRLPDAIENETLRLAYQPITNVKTGAIVSLEALARWTDDELGEIGPGEFIPVAERRGIIYQLGEWVIRSACRQISAWSEMGYSDFTVSVNLSADQLHSAQILDTISDALAEFSVEPERLIIEITESMLIDNTDFVASQVKAIRSLGLGLAIDDFGTGYSSLSYLQRYEFDVLKVDRSFITPMGDPTNLRERAIVRSMIALAQELGAAAVAEGIETEAEFTAMAELGCDRVQGFFLHRPLEVADVAAVLGQVSELKAS